MRASRCGAELSRNRVTPRGSATGSACRPRRCAPSWCGAGSTGSPMSIGPPVSRSAATNTSGRATYSTSTSRSSARSPTRRLALRRPLTGREEPLSHGRTDSGSAQQAWQSADRYLLPAHSHRRPFPRCLRRSSRRRDQGDRDRGPLQRRRLVRRPRRHCPTGAQRQQQLLQVQPLARDLCRPGHHTEEDPTLPSTDQRQDL